MTARRRFLIAAFAAFVTAYPAMLDAAAMAESAAASAPVKPLAPLVQPRQPDGTGTVAISGELRQWHKVTLTLDGPFAHERDHEPNPLTDYALNMTFAHESGSPRYIVPGYFAADGDAANTSAEAGMKWRAHLSPDKPGKWNYRISFAKGRYAAVSDAKGEAMKPFDGQTGSFTIAPTNKTGRDFRAKGRLQYVGKRYLRFAGTKEYFLKCGADAPENSLAYRDFDGDFKTDGHKDDLVKDWKPHVQDWRPGDPTWQGGKGKGIIGAVNYLAGGWGVEYYFGYKLPQNDLDCQDYRSRARSWDQGRIALEFFRENRIPIWEMKNADALVGNAQNDNSKYCFAKPGDLYLVYLPTGGTTTLDLSGVTGSYTVQWFDPRNGGSLVDGTVRKINAGSSVSIGPAPNPTSSDWVAWVTRVGFEAE